MKNLPSWHYYESHITIAPVFGEALEVFKELCSQYKFRAADLLMQKRPEDTPERSKFDTFATSRNSFYPTIVLNTIFLVRRLQDEGFKVYRYKIESTLVDSRHEDAFGLHL